MIYVIGAGITGCTIARRLKDFGKNVTIIERNKIGGNCRTKMIDDVEVHLHGAHTWHNSDHEVQEFMNRFTKFKQYTHHKFIKYKDKFYRIPINREILKEYTDLRPIIINGDSFENYLTSLVGKELFEIYYKNYSLKQWGTLNIPIDIAKRIPIRFDDSINYFHDDYQALPENYNKMFENMIEGIEVIYSEFKNFVYNSFDPIIYTGALDELFDYDAGVLSYRTIDHTHKVFHMNYYQPCGTLNYTDETPYVRTVEHKHFNNHNMSGKTIVSFQQMREFHPGDIPYYPMWDYDLYDYYKKKLPKNFIPAGRLGRYKYLDMNTAVRDALKLAEEICS